jgi:elongation of very long chain fatty acids protein 4
VSVSFFWWMAYYLMPGGDSWVGSALNSTVHVVMYSYYLLASMSRSPDFRRKYLWWGKYLTTFQILQFVENLLHCIGMIKFSWYDKTMATFGVWYMVTLLTLFGNFYVQKYINKKSKKE